MRVSEEIDDVHPCDMDVADTQDLVARACTGSTAFFFIKNSATHSRSDPYVNSDPLVYDPVPGFDKLGTFNLNALDVAMAAYNSHIEVVLRIGSLGRDPLNIGGTDLGVL